MSGVEKMNPNLCRQIEDFFVLHESDGEFAAPIREWPFTVTGPAPESEVFVYATKVGSTLLGAIAEFGGTLRSGILGRPALPSASDATWIRRLTANARLHFFGDLDPPDLLIFAWLRESLSPQAVVYLGVNDAMLLRLNANVPDNYSIPLSPAECDAVELVEQVLPDVYELIGPRCAGILQSRRKLEIEAVISTLRSVEPLLELFAAP